MANSKLPRLLRISKYGFVTTLAATVLGTSLVFAQSRDERDSNLQKWQDASLGTLTVSGNRIFERCEYNEETGAYELKGGMLYALNGLQSAVFENNNQVSGIRYVAHTLEKANVISPVYAQATGYSMLQPGLAIWQVSRNLALLFMVGIGLVIAIMILLRVRAGQGYVTLVSSLPKIIGTILLILMSYSIGGFAIDIGNIATKFIVSKGAILNPKFIRQSIITDFGDTDAGTMYPLDYKEAIEDTYDHVAPSAISPGDKSWKTMNVFRLIANMSDFSNWPGCDKTPTGECRVADIIRTPTGIQIVDGGKEFLESWEETPDKLLELVLNLYIVIVAFKIFFMLVQAFAEMVIKVAAAPLMLVALPFTSFEPFISWLRGVLSSSLVFPVSFLMMFLAAYFSGQGYAPWWIQPDAVHFEKAPEMLTHTISDVGFVGNLIAIAVLSMVPNVKKMVEGALKVVPLDVGAAGSTIKGLAAKIPVVGSVVGMMG